MQVACGLIGRLAVLVIKPGVPELLVCMGNDSRYKRIQCLVRYPSEMVKLCAPVPAPLEGERARDSRGSDVRGARVTKVLVQQRDVHEKLEDGVPQRWLVGFDCKVLSQVHRTREFRHVAGRDEEARWIVQVRVIFPVFPK